MYEKIAEKIGIITFYHGNYNFGGLLQAYALPTVLEKCFGISAEQIDYIYMPEQGEKKKEKLSIGKIIYKAGIIFFDRMEKKNINKRKKVFDQFIQEIPHSNWAYKYDTISESLKTYHTFICGGDQIWNEWENHNTEVFTLQFVPLCLKKIAYAPSMAILEATPSFKKIMSNGLNRLDAVSVREKKSLSILKPLTDKRIEVVADPVLLMTDSDWLMAAREPENKGKYILCYLLGDSMEHRKAVKKIAKRLRLPILTFPHVLCNVVRKCDLFFGDIRDYSSGPREFLGLIKNAEFVITDSFHACVFSMIFETPFMVFERNKIGEKENMNSRIYDFLEEYHLERQLLTEKELTAMKEIPKIDFTYAHKHWKIRREESLGYLENALKDNLSGHNSEDN